MRYMNLKKEFFLIIIFIFTFNCNYKPLLNNDRLKQLKFHQIETSGNKRIAQIIVNKLNIVKDKKGVFVISVNGKKSVDIANKSVTGKILNYSITLECDVEIKNSLSGKILYTKKITNSQNYKASSMYSDTVSKEKKIIEDVSSLMAKQIINEMSLSLRNDI
jgi:hypothetical protein|tara:strand:- start:394 stop:879 length:486 start_codon:yes stop_codon:yes gene_type:complete